MKAGDDDAFRPADVMDALFEIIKKLCPDRPADEHEPAIRMRFQDFVRRAHEQVLPFVGANHANVNNQFAVFRNAVAGANIAGRNLRMENFRVNVFADNADIVVRGEPVIY